jgi:uncharacterized protein
MPISFYDISTGTHLRGLSVLSRLLDSAKAHAAAENIPIDELVEWRLIDDMNPLSFQVYYACYVAINFLKVAAHLDDVPAIEHNEKTFADLEARIASTVELLNGIDRTSVEGNEDKLATLPESVAKWGQFTGLQQLLGGNLPNFYFHLVTAYDILRAKGVPVGKRDFLRPHFASFATNQNVQ